jgi:hypothetical protein
VASSPGRLKPDTGGRDPPTLVVLDVGHAVARPSFLPAGVTGAERHGFPEDSLGFGLFLSCPPNRGRHRLAYGVPRQRCGLYPERTRQDSSAHRGETHPSDPQEFEIGVAGKKSRHRMDSEAADVVTVGNTHPRPFQWTKTAEEILESLARYCRRISGA